MFHRHRLSFISSVLVVLLAALGAAAVRLGVIETFGPELSLPVTPLVNAVQTDGSRNLALQPEAAKLSRKLGKRFAGSKVSSLLGELTVNNQRFSVQIVRRQNGRGERLEIWRNGKPESAHME